MISYRLLGQQGALGNQLWEIAGTYGIATREGTTPIFPKWFYEPFFSVPPEFFGDIPEDSRDLGEDYLQDLSHWSPDHEAEVRRMFAPSALSVASIGPDVATLNDAVAVHVRRGNNITERYAAYHPSPPVEYFEEALDILGNPSRVVVFSDDIAWCKTQSIFHKASFAVGPPENIDIMELTKYGPVGTSTAAMDLLSMTFCSRHVISNSSFSWWGAWLGHSQRVIYPKRWYGEPLKHIDTSVMFDGLSNWSSL